MRLATHLEVGGLLRAVNGAGGFATVLAKGEHDAGTLLVVTRDRDANPRLYERMPQMDGSRRWALTKVQDAREPRQFDDYLSRRKAQDPDLWIVELDIRDGERFIDGLAKPD